MRKRYRFSAFFRTNRFLFIAAAVVSVILWFYVAGVATTTTKKEFNNIPLNISIIDTVPESKGLMVLSGAPATVDVEVSGERTDVALVTKDKIVARVDINSVTVAGTYTLSVDAYIENSAANVTVVSPSSVTLTFEEKVTANVPVKINVSGTLPQGYMLDTPKAFPQTVEIEGPASEIDRIKYVQTELDITDAKDTISKKMSYVLTDASGNHISSDNITASTDTVTLTAPVLITKTVPLSVTVTNSSGGNTAKMITTEITPESITVAGNESALSEINSIELASVDFAEIGKEGYKKELPIVCPNGIKLINEETKATVSVTMGEYTTKTVNVTNIEFTNDDGMNVNMIPNYISVTVRGQSSVLSEITSDDINGIIDLSEVTAKGNVQCAVTFELPSETAADIQGKYSVLVNIR